MISKLLIGFLILVGLFTVSGWMCFSENPYLIEARNALGIEQGCTIRRQYQR